MELETEHLKLRKTGPRERGRRLKRGMEAKSKEFVEKGSTLYA